MLVVLVLGLTAVFVIPFLIPVHDGLSDSYVFGFSNRTAILLVIALTLGFAIWTRGLGLQVPDPTARPDSRFRLTAAIATVCGLAACGLAWLFAKMVTPLWEAQYFLDRYAMFGMGRRLYSDFVFDYGPLMFYPSVWIANLFHLSLANGYFAGWVLQCAVGTWVLWKVIDVAARGTRHGRTIFLLLWLLFLGATPDSGANYTPLRFCATLGFALWVHALYARRASSLAIFGAACVGSTTMLLYSPEQGIALAMGTVLFFLICVRPVGKDLLLGLVGFVLVMVGIGRATFRLGLLANVGRAGGGALNLPLLFSFQSVVLLLLLVVAGCVFVASLRAKTADGPLLYLICISLATAPAAFSRADPGHIIINTLGALIAVLVVLSQYPALWRWTWSSFAVVLLLSTLES